MKKSKIVSLILVVMLLVSVVPCFAQPTQQPQFSMWALHELNEGERLATYSQQWYYDGFLDEITQERLQSILNETSKKMKNLGYEENSNFKPLAVNGVTRRDVVNGLFNTLAKYDLGEALDLGNDPIAYMQGRGILKGTKEGLELDRNSTTQEASVLSVRLVLDTYNVLNKGSKGLMWKVTKGENTVYILGSIHLGRSDMYPIRQEVQSAFDSADELVVEADMTDANKIAEFQRFGMYSDSTTLKDHVSAELYEKFVKACQKLGLPEQMAVLKIWQAANTLNAMNLSNSGNQEEQTQAAITGADAYYLSKAMITGKPITELEGLMTQAKMFDALDEKVLLEYFTSVLDSILEEKEEKSEEAISEEAQLITQMQDTWIKGNADEFIGYMNKQSESESETAKAFNKMLFGKRDRGMADKIETMLEAEGSKTYFIVIGAGHLTYENTVRDNLVKDGYEVEFIK